MLYVLNGAHDFYARALLAVSIIPLFYRMFEVLLLDTRTGPLIVAIEHILHETGLMMLFFIVAFVGFAQCAHILFGNISCDHREEDAANYEDCVERAESAMSMYGTFGRSLRTLIMTFLGFAFHEDVFLINTPGVKMLGPIVVMCFLYVTFILLLNM